MSKSREQQIRDAVELLARERGVTLKPAGGRTFDVDLPDMQLTVEITMKVTHQVRRDEARALRDTALARLADPKRGRWEDQCGIQVRDRGSFSYGRTKSCSKPVIGVVITRYGGDDETIYHFRCRCHLARPVRDETRVVFRDTLSPHDLAVARRERAEGSALIDKLAKMTPDELVAHDAAESHRHAEASLILENALPTPTPPPPPWDGATKPDIA